VAIKVTPVNDNNPLAVADSITVNEGGTGTVLDSAATSVLANDSDSDLPGDTLTAVLDSGPSFASSFTLNPDGTFSYQHDGSENFSDSFSYLVFDGVNSSNTVVVTMTINPLNDNAPVFTSTSTPTVPENTPIIVTLTATDADLPGQTVTFSIVGGADAALFSINGADKLMIVPPPDFESPTDANLDNVYEVAVQADDGNGGTTIQNISVTITNGNEAPVITSGAATSVAENTTTVMAITSTDLDGGAPTYSISGGADAALFTINPTTGDLNFVTAPNFESPADTNSDNIHEVSVRVVDGNGGMDEQLVSVTVTDANDAPSSADDNYTVDKNNTLTDVVPGVLAGDFDEDSDPLTVTLVSGPANGTLTLNVDGSFSYTPYTGYSGNDSFTYQADDGNGGLDTATVRITINAAGRPVDPPVVDPPPPSSDPPPETGDPPPPTVDPPATETRTTTPGPAPQERRTIVPSMATGGMLSSGLVVADQQDFGSTFAYQRSVTANRVLREAMTPETVELLERFMAPFDVGLLANDLQEMVEQLSQDTSFAQVMSGSAVGISGAFTVGYVLWTIRGGWLLTSLLAQMPAWRMVDPLVVLSYLDEESAKSDDPTDEEDDSLESLLDKQTEDESPAHLEDGAASESSIARTEAESMT
jgi:hypothetical protein